jgi:hypothetical protein
MNFINGVETLQEALDDAYPILLALDYVCPARTCADIIDTIYTHITLNTDLFVGSLPDSPGRAFCFYDSGGLDQDDRNSIDHSRVQLMGRGSYEECFTNVEEIKRVLQSIPKMVLNDYTLLGVWVASSTVSIGKDEQNLFKFSLNFRIMIEPGDNGNRMAAPQTLCVDPLNLVENEW